MAKKEINGKEIAQMEIAILYFGKSQLSIFLVLFRGIQKPKCFGSFFGVYFVVYVVGVHYAFHILILSRIFDFDSSVYY